MLKGEGRDVPPKDCIECRIVGMVTFSGIAGYAAYLRMATPKSDRGQRLFLGGIVVGATCVAIHRAIF